MPWKTLALICAAVLTLGATPKPKVSPAKPPTPAHKPASAPASTGDFDPRNPTNLVTLLNGAGGKAEVVRQEEDSVLVIVKSTAADFSMQFVGCDAHGRACKAVLFDNLTDKAGPTFAQLNAFNQTSATCRGYEDRAGKPHVIYSTLLFEGDSQDRMRQQFLAWTGCVAEFRNFLRDPNAYLAAAA